MSQIKEHLKQIGFFYTDEEVNPYSYNPADYKPNSNDNKSEIHRNFLKSLESEESNRLSLIESKTSQLISQTGIIFSLLSLFVPILIDKVSDLHFSVKLILLFLLVLSFCFYMLTIKNALKNFNVSKFKYSKPSPNNVLKFQDSNTHDFYAEEVRDLLYCINENLKINNRKATNLLHSYNSFRIGNTLTGILVVFFSIVLLFFDPRKEGTIIEEPIKIEGLDSTINELRKAVLLKDTIFIKNVDSTKPKR